MVRKITLLSFSLLLLSGFAFGQACTPDPLFTKNGVHPDSATGFDTADVGIPYTQLVTIVIPNDTAAFPPPFPPIAWDSTVLSGLTGLPASMNYACWNNSASSNRCAWKRNTKGCAIITGTPTAADVGTHNLVFSTNNYLGSQTTPNPYTISYYKIVVMAAGSVNENPDLQVIQQNNPNPFDDKTEIVFTSEGFGTVQFKVYNMIGTAVQEYDIAVKQGVNKLILDAKDFDSGIYFYALVSGSNAFTRKMVVKK